MITFDGQFDRIGMNQLLAMLFEHPANGLDGKVTVSLVTPFAQRGIVVIGLRERAGRDRSRSWTRRRTCNS